MLLYLKRGDKHMIQDLKSTNVVREFSRVRDTFQNLRGQETPMTMAFQCLEHQIASLVKKGIIRSDDEVLQALAAVGLLAYDHVSENQPRNWGALPQSVQQLARRLTQCFDPASNSTMQQATDTAWTTPEEPLVHFHLWGSVVRRLMDSVRARQKRDPRGYCRFVVPFVAQWSDVDDDDEVQWALLSQSIDALPSPDLP